MQSKNTRYQQALLFIATLAVSGLTAAQGWGQGQVGRIYAGPASPARVFFAVNELGSALNGSPLTVVDASHHNKPACSTVGGEWVLDTSTPGGQQAYELLLQNSVRGNAVIGGGAFSSGWDVRVMGTGACTTVPDREDVLYIYTLRVSPGAGF